MKIPLRRLALIFSAACILPAAFAAREFKPPRVPDDVTARRDIPYVAGGHPSQKLDLYLPDSPKDARLPLIIWIHGGGWRGGSKNNCLPLLRGFTRRGYAVASIDYRLSTTAVFPAQIEDCKAAVRWLRVNAAAHRLDPARFVAWGSSAGGHLAAHLGVTSGVTAFDKGENLRHSSAVQAVIDYYGPADFCDETLAAPTFLGENTGPARLIGGPLRRNREKAAAASPVTYASKDAAPIYILHGDKDEAVPLSQSLRLHTVLKNAGATVRLKILAGAGHGGPPFSDPALLDTIDAFIRASF